MTSVRAVELLGRSARVLHGGRSCSSKPGLDAVERGPGRHVLHLDAHTGQIIYLSPFLFSRVDFKKYCLCSR